MSIDAMRGMMSGVGGATGVGGTVGVQAPKESFDAFESMKSGVTAVNQQIVQSEKASQAFAVKGEGNLHEVMIALDQADVSFRYMQQIRNKVLDAYNDVIRMPV